MTRIRSFFGGLINKYKSANLVLKASVWFLAITVIDKSISVLTQPIINRILTESEVGTYGVFQSWYLILSIVATFNLFGGVLEVYITKNKEMARKISNSLACLSLIICTVSFGIISIFINPLSSFLGLKPSYIFLMFGMIIGESLFQFWAVPKRFAYSYKTYSFVTVGVFATKSLLTILLAYLFVSDRVLGRILGLCLPSLIAGVTLFIISLKKDKAGVSLWKTAIKFNLPLLPHYLCTVLLSSSDRFMIEKLVGINETGLYTVCYSFASLCLIVFTALNNAYNPFSMKCIKNKEYDKLSSSTNVLVVFSILFSLLLIYFAPEGIYIIGGPNYSTTLSIVPILVVGIFFSSFYFIFSNIEFVHEKVRFVFPITLFGAVLNILLNYFLLPIYGYKVAAYTTFLGYFVIALLHYIVSWFILKRNIYNMPFIIISLLIFIGLSFLAMYLYTVHFAIRLSVAFVILASFILLAIFRKKLFKHKNKTIITTTDEKTE